MTVKKLTAYRNITSVSTQQCNYVLEVAYSRGRKFSDRLLPTDISVRPEDFLKCIKWNETYPVISSISWLNPLTQETKKFAGKDVQGRIVSTSKHVSSPISKIFGSLPPPPTFPTHHAPNTLSRLYSAVPTLWDCTRRKFLFNYV